MATDKFGNELMRGDTVVRDAGDVVEVSEPLTDTAIVTVVTSETINPATCRVIATIDGRTFATEAPAPTPPPPAPTPPPEPVALFSYDASTDTLAKTENGISFLVDGGQMRIANMGDAVGSALHFPMIPDSGGFASAEQRMRLGNQYPELWIRQEIYIPNGQEPGATTGAYYHGQRAPGTGGDNNKWLMAWYDPDLTDASDGYSGRMHFGFNTVPSSRRGGAVGDSDLIIVWKVNNSPQSSDGFPTVRDFINTADHGRMMTLVYRFRADQNDGRGNIIELWKNGTKVMSHTWAAYSSGSSTFSQMYWLGYLNYCARAMTLRMPRFKFHTSNIFGVS